MHRGCRQTRRQSSGATLKKNSARNHGHVPELFDAWSNLQASSVSGLIDFPWCAKSEFCLSPLPSCSMRFDRQRCGAELSLTRALVPTPRPTARDTAHDDEPDGGCRRGCFLSSCGKWSSTISPRFMPEGSADGCGLKCADSCAQELCGGR